MTDDTTNRGDLSETQVGWIEAVMRLLGLSSAQQEATPVPPGIETETAPDPDPAAIDAERTRLRTAAEAITILETASSAERQELQTAQQTLLARIAEASGLDELRDAQSDLDGLDARAEAVRAAVEVRRATAEQLEGRLREAPLPNPGLLLPDHDTAVAKARETIEAALAPPWTDARLEKAETAIDGHLAMLAQTIAEAEKRAEAAGEIRAAAAAAARSVTGADAGEAETLTALNASIVKRLEPPVTDAALSEARTLLETLEAARPDIETTAEHRRLRRGRALSDLGAIGDPEHARPDDIAALAKLRTSVSEALAEDTPTEPDLRKAEHALELLRGHRERMVGEIAAALAEKAKLLEQAQIPTIGGVTGDETTELEALAKAIADAMPGPAAPTKTELGTARAALTPLLAGIERVKAAAGRRKAAREALETEWAAAKAKVEAAAGIDPGLYASSSEHGALVAAIDKAKEIQTLATNALASADPALHEDATAKIKAWMAAPDVAGDLRDAAAAEIKDELQSKYDGIKSWLSWVTDPSLDGFLPAEVSALTPLITALKPKVQAIKDALAGNDTAEHLAQLAAIDGVEADGDVIEGKLDKATAGKRARAAEAKGATPAQAAALGALGTGNEDAYKAAKAIFDATSGVLGGATPTTDFVAGKKSAMTQADKDWDDAWDAFQAAKKELKQARTERDAARAERDKIKQQIDDAIAAAGDSPAPGLPELHAKLEAAQQVVDAAKAKVSAAKTTFNEKRSANSTAKDAYKDAKKVFDAADKQKRMMDAIAFGPLSPKHGNALSDDVTTEMLKVYDKSPELADAAAESASKAKHPESVAAAALLVADGAAQGFKSADGSKKMGSNRSQRYAKGVVDMAGNFGPDGVGMLEAYLGADKHFEADPGVHAATYSELYKKRTEFVSAALFDASTGALKLDEYEDPPGTKNKMLNIFDADGNLLRDGSGKVKLDGAAGALAEVMFHPQATYNPSPELATHMMETLGFLDFNGDQLEKIEAADAPTDAGAKGLLARGSGKDAAAIGKADVQKAVMQAMLTPVYQGNVGSCFATASIVKMRKDYPKDTLDCFIEMATEGTFTPLVGDKVPVVQNVPTDENALVRSLEYSAATATALMIDSTRKTELRRASNAGTDTFEDKIKAEKWVAVQAKIDRILRTSFSFIYDPEAVIDLASDGSSNRGRYVLTNKADGAPINSKDDYLAVVRPQIEAAIAAEDLADGVSAADITALANSDSFLNALKRDGKLPWELSSGGQTDEASKVLFGAGMAQSDMLGKANPATSTAPGRTRDVLDSLLTTFDGSTEDMVTIRTVGMHGFNALPTHPSMQALLDGGPGKFDDNIDELLVTPGTAIKDTEIPLDRAVYLFEKEMNAIGSKEKAAEARTALLDAIATNRPTAAMKPADFKTLIKTATTAYVDKKAELDAKAWKEKETVKSGTAPSSDAYDEKLAELKERHGKSVDAASTNALASAMGSPQIVVADTNWGSGEDHVFFVIMPDPATGELRMYKKREPGGELSEVEKKWVDANWAVIQ